jgi:hypothetical protein
MPACAVGARPNAFNTSASAKLLQAFESASTIDLSDIWHGKCSATTISGESQAG